MDHIMTNQNLFNLIIEIGEEDTDSESLFPTLEKSPDLSDFDKQFSDLPSFEFEWVEQNGCDGFYHGRMAYQIDDDYFLIFRWFD